MNKKYSSEIVEVIRNYLTGDDWHFSFDDPQGCSGSI